MSRENTALNKIAFLDELDVRPSSLNPRIMEISLPEAKVAEFVSATKDVLIAELERSSLARYELALLLRELLPNEFEKIARAQLMNRHAGAILIALDDTLSHDAYIKVWTAIGHLIGPVHSDTMSKLYYSVNTLTNLDDASIVPLKNPYEPLHLHTDGQLSLEVTNWLMMSKMHEENAIGGDSTILHIYDWEDFSTYSSIERLHQGFPYHGAKEYELNQAVNCPIFTATHDGMEISFNARRIVLSSLEEAELVSRLTQSMQKSEKKVVMELPVGSAIFINNRVWMHGRKAFQKNIGLRRSLMRMRGSFYKG